MGVLAAVRHGRLADQVVRVLGLVGYSAPIFWLGLLGLLVFYARLGWVEGPGRIDIAYEYDVTRQTGLLLLDSALQGRLGRLPQRLRPHHPAGARCSATSRWPTSAG